MKTLICSCLIILVLLSGQLNAVTVEEFRRLPIPERDAVIKSASGDQRKEFEEIDRQLMLQFMYGGEKGWKQHEQQRAINARGFTSLLTVFNVEQEFAYQAFVARVDAARKLETPRERLADIERQADSRYEGFKRRFFEEIFPALAGLAPTSAALQLEAEAKKINDEVVEPMGDGKIPVTEDTVASLEKRLAPLLPKLNALPKLTPAEVEAELDALPAEQPHR
jgi:hypothetical protein